MNTSSTSESTAFPAALAWQRTSKLAEGSRLLDVLPQYIIVTDMADKVVFCNRAALGALGYKNDELLGRNIKQFVFGSVPETREQRFSDGANNVVGITKFGKPLELHASASRIVLRSDTLKVLTAWPACYHAAEAQALRKLAARLADTNLALTEQVNTDSLTGALNRRGLQTALVRELGLANRTGERSCVAMFDLDNFKRINDNYGHAAGDAVLKAVSERLRECVRASDYLARVGGDEFIVLMPATTEAAALRTAERCVGAINASPVVLVPEPILVTVSSGISAVPGSVKSIEELLLLTQSALHCSKAQGKNRASLGKTCQPADERAGGDRP